jgi:hypothetical protein
VVARSNAKLKTFLSLLCLYLFCVTSQVRAQTPESVAKKWDLGASAKIRAEGSGNKDFSSATDDNLDFISSSERSNHAGQSLRKFA